MKVEILYFDGCPSYREAQATLSVLFALDQPCDQSLWRVIYQLGVDVVRVVHDPLRVGMVGLVELV
jgi:hypothetical protein